MVKIIFLLTQAFETEICKSKARLLINIHGFDSSTTALDSKYLPSSMNVGGDHMSRQHT